MRCTVPICTSLYFTRRLAGLQAAGGVEGERDLRAAVPEQLGDQGDADECGDDRD